MDRLAVAARASSSSMLPAVDDDNDGPAGAGDGFSGRGGGAYTTNAEDEAVLGQEEFGRSMSIVPAFFCLLAFCCAALGFGPSSST